MIRYATNEMNKEMKIDLDSFINLFNENKAILLDIRDNYETKVWNIPFALHIPADELPNRLNELPKDKIIVAACPFQNRSPFAAMFLKNNGFDARYLEKGLLNLMENLKGPKAKKLNLGE